MYAPSKVRLGLPDGTSEWPSDAHRRVAECALGFKDEIVTVADLRRCVQVICEYTEDQIKVVTVEELRNKGLPL